MRPRVEFNVGDRALALEIGMEQLEQIEGLLELHTVQELGDVLKSNRIRFREWVGMFAIGLKGADPQATREQASEIMTELGFQPAVFLVNRSITIAMLGREPKAAELEESDDQGKDQEAPATDPPSSENGASGPESLR